MLASFPKGPEVDELLEKLAAGSGDGPAVTHRARFEAAAPVTEYMLFRPNHIAIWRALMGAREVSR